MAFLKRFTKNALTIKLRSEGFSCLQQCPVEVFFMGEVVGSYSADIIADGKIIIEIKAGDSVHIPAHEYQLINYLKANGNRSRFTFIFRKESYCKTQNIFEPK